MKNDLQWKIYFWNAFGSMVSAGMSVVIIMVITHTAGTYDAGIFSLGYANAMLFTNIGTLDTRSHQCANADGKFSFSDYFTFRIITGGFMLVLSVMFVLIFQYSIEKMLVTLFLCIYCAIINVSDIFQGNAQVRGRLDLGGQSLAIRSIINLLVFSLWYIYTENLLAALALMIVSALLWVIIYDKKEILLLEKPHFYFEKKKLRSLFYEAFPLGACLTLQAGIFNIPKYAIDNYLIVDMQAVYSIIFMPAFIINLFGIMIYRPILFKIALMWREGKTRDICKILLEKIGILAVITLMVAIAGYVCGASFLSLLYGINLAFYKKELVVLLLGGGFTGIANLLYFVVTVIKKQYFMLWSYICVFLISCLISYPMVERNMLMGAAVSYLITSIVSNLLLAIIVVKWLKKDKREFIQ